MSLEEKMRASAARYVRHGEQVHAVIGAQTKNPYLVVLVGFWYLLFNRYRMIVVTSERIAVLDAGKVSFKRPRAVLYEHHRDTQLGPAAGRFWHKADLGDETLYVHRRFFNELAKADLAVLG
jgi:hypothetical protein